MSPEANSRAAATATELDDMVVSLTNISSELLRSYGRLEERAQRVEDELCLANAELEQKINADDVLQSAGARVDVTFEGGRLVITSAQYGSTSEVTISTADAGAAGTLGIGVSAGTSTSGLDVAGTIGGVAATGSGQTLTGSGSAAGLSIEVLGGGLGSRNTATTHDAKAQPSGQAWKWAVEVNVVGQKIFGHGLSSGRRRGTVGQHFDGHEDRRRDGLELVPGVVALRVVHGAVRGSRRHRFF